MRKLAQPCPFKLKRNILDNSLANEYNIRSYRPGDELGIVKLLQLVFNGWPRLDLSCTPLDHWRWKCMDGPYKSNFIALGVINDRIIGAMHSLSYKIKIGNDYYISHYAGDTAVHPDFRRWGLTKKMIDFSNNQLFVDLLFSLLLMLLHGIF